MEARAKLVRRSLGVLLLGAATAGAQEPVSQADLMKVIENQTAQLNALSQRLQNLETTQTQMKTVMKETNEAVSDQNKKLEQSSSLLSLGKGIDNLKITGDLRLRYEARDVQVPNRATGTASGDRTRIRDRFRLNGVWTNKTEGWEVGAGLATGNDRAGRSSNSDWGRQGGDNNVFDHQEIWLDNAYVKHKFDYEGTPVSLFGGQLAKNPNVSTILTWDNDLRPTGVGAQYGDPYSKDYAGPIFTAGAYEVAYLSDGSTVNGKNDYSTKVDDNVWWFPVQGGYKYKGENSDFLAIGGYQHLNGAYRNAANWYKNSQVPNNAYGGADTGYKYDILETYLEYKTTYAGFELKPYTHVAYNMGAQGNKNQGGNKGKAANNLSTDPGASDNKLAWMLGMDVRRGKWTLGYGYAYIGADAVFGPMRDSDFGETAGLTDTDIQGHIIRLGYDITKNCNVGGSLMMLQRNKGGTATRAANAEADKAALVQLDLNYKF